MSILDELAPLPQSTPMRGEGRPKRYPKGIVSGSTLAGWYGSSYQLVQWAKRTFYDGAIAGIPFEELDARDTDIGTLVHEMIECSLHSEPMPDVPEEYREAVESAFSAWHGWVTKNRMIVLATEMPFYDEAAGLGGTIDAILRDEEGRLAIGDWKTSKQLRSSYLVQLAIYGLVWDSNNDEKITGGYHLLRFSKEGGRLAHLHFPDLDDALELALLLRQAYTKSNEVRKAAGLAY